MDIPQNIVNFTKHTGRKPVDETEQQSTAHIRILLRKIRAGTIEIKGPLATWLEQALARNLEEVIIYLLHCEETTSTRTSPEST